MKKETSAGTGTTASNTEAAILEDALKVDAAADTQSKKNPVDQVLAGLTPDGAAEPLQAPVAVPDPAIVQSLTFIVQMGTQLMTARYSWDDPGDEWRQEVGKLAAALVDRYLPGVLSEQGELVALVVMVGTYAGANILNGKTSRSYSAPGAKGERKNDIFVEPPEGRGKSDSGHS